MNKLLQGPMAHTVRPLSLSRPQDTARWMLWPKQLSHGQPRFLIAATMLAPLSVVMQTSLCPSSQQSAKEDFQVFSKGVSSMVIWDRFGLLTLGGQSPFFDAFHAVVQLWNCRLWYVCSPRQFVLAVTVLQYLLKCWLFNDAKWLHLFRDVPNDTLCECTFCTVLFVFCLPTKRLTDCWLSRRQRRPLFSFDCNSFPSWETASDDCTWSEDVYLLCWHF